MRQAARRNGAARRAMRPVLSLPSPRPLLFLAAVALLACGRPAHAQSCDPDADATYTAAVLEYSPALGVTLENVQERFHQNVLNYVTYAKEAKRQGAEIVVFPECGLATLELPRLPDSSPAVALALPPVGSNPCVETDVQHAQELRDLSCAARDSAIYIVVNLPEVERCFPTLAFCPECPGFEPHAVRSGIVACNTDGKRYFNSDIAFDRKGAVVARYRKYNLFGEAGFVAPAEASLEYFDSDFGVRFGLFTCFDLMFETPAVALVTEAGVTDVIFPTAWFSELPFLTAVQAQASWAWVLDVNFLGAGYNLPEVGSTGTGLYAGRRGKVVATMERERTNKLLVGRLPNRNACSYNSTAAAEFSGKIVVLSRKHDSPTPRAAPPPPQLLDVSKSVAPLPSTGATIPSLYQCHLQSLLALKDGRRLINPETGEEAEESPENVKYELHYLREADDDEAEVRADEDEFKEAVAPRGDGEASLIYGPRFRQYIEDVIMRGVRRLHDKSNPSPHGGGDDPDEEPIREVDFKELKNEVEELLLPKSRLEELEEKYNTPTLGDTVGTMTKKLEEMVGKQGMENEEQQYDYLLHRHEEYVEREKLHNVQTPPINDTLTRMGTQIDTLGDPRGRELMQEAMKDELEREKLEMELKMKEAGVTCQRLGVVPCVEEEPVVEEQQKDLNAIPAETKHAEVEIIKEEKHVEAIQEPEPVVETAELKAEEEGRQIDESDGVLQEEYQPVQQEASPRCQCVRSSRPHAPVPQDEYGDDAVSGPAGEQGISSMKSSDDDGYLYLKTEDLSNYVTVLLPAVSPSPAVFENSSLKLCHDSFCCHFQVVMTVIQGEGTTSATDEEIYNMHKVDGSGGNDDSEESSFGNIEEAEGMSFVQTRRRSPIGGPLAKHFIIPEGEEEDYVEDDDEDDDDDDDDDEDVLDPEEMEPTEDEYDDDEEVQMDTSAEFSMDPVLLQASGIGHYGPSAVFNGSVEPKDMEPSEDTIRAQAIADRREEELKEMEGHTPPPAHLPPDVEEEALEPEEPAAYGEPEEHIAAELPKTAAREDQRYYYRVAVFNGRRTFDGITDGGLQVCAVIPCTGVTTDTCGKLHQFPSDLALTTFKHVRISGRFSRVRSLPLPSTLDANLMPLSADTFSLTATVRRKETDIVMETHKPVNFLTFGIYNRNFGNDPERQATIG